jgi:hypothetical protein
MRIDDFQESARGVGGQILHFMLGKRLFSKGAIENEEDPRAFLRSGFWASLRAQSRLTSLPHRFLRVKSHVCLRRGVVS